MLAIVARLGSLGVRMPQTPPETLSKTLSPRHRQRVMAALLSFRNLLELVAKMIVFRYRSTEAGETIAEYIEAIDEIRTLADARDRLGEILESPLGAIKPPQLDQKIRGTMQALFNAMDPGDGLRWPEQLILARQLAAGMVDPYSAARLDLRRIPGGGVIVELGRSVQSPAASHSNSVGVTPSLATSRSVTASRSRNVPQKTGSASTMACAAI